MRNGDGHFLHVIVTAEREQAHFQIQQIPTQRACVHISIRRVLRQSLIQNCLQAFGNISQVIAQRRYLFFRVHHGNGNSSFAIKGNLASKHFKKHYAQGIHVAGSSNLSTSCLLRRKIMNRTHYSRGIDHGLIAYHFSNAKICNSRIQIFINQNILGFNIAVNNVLAMSVLQCICQAYANFQNCAYGKLIVL